jgi:hypothetical protein
MSDQEIPSVVRRIVTMLVDGDYNGLQSLTRGRRLNADEIAEAVRVYGAKLTMPPEHAFNELDIIEVENAEPRRWSVRLDLWTADEGKSDLTLELTLADIGGDQFSVEIADIHVL